MVTKQKEKPTEPKAIKRTAGGKFAPGAQANPGGRPKVIGLIRELAQTYGEEAFNKIVALTDSDDPKVALAACREILDRAYGKPEMSHKIEGESFAKTVVVIRDIANRTSQKENENDELSE
jgi:hypothetical protein